MRKPIMIFMLFFATQVFAEQEPQKQPDTDQKAPRGSLLDRRIALENASKVNPFAITPHKPTYILPLTYNSSPNNQPYTDRDIELNEFEMKFQLSIKIPVWQEILGDNSNLYFGYTQQSHWQAYNWDYSSPFRETNYEPEVMLSFLNDLDIFGFKHRVIMLGLSHQSNGQSGELSRSWNRIYADFIFERGNLVFSIKPWYRIPEKKEDDDNPDIDKYMGHGEFKAVYQSGRNTLGMLFRYQDRGAIQIDWTYPIPKSKVKGYVQYFNGYGESLIDYDDSSNRISIGIMLTDWL